MENVGIPGIRNGRWPAYTHIVKEMRIKNPRLSTQIEFRLTHRMRTMPDNEFRELFIAAKKHWLKKHPGALAGWGRSRRHLLKDLWPFRWNSSSLYRKNKRGTVAVTFAFRSSRLTPSVHLEVKSLFHVCRTELGTAECK